MLILLAALALQQDTTLLVAAGTQGRAFATAHATAAAGRGATAAQYRLALAALDSGKWDDASVRLHAVSRLDSHNPAVKGDLGYALARRAQWDDAADAYQAASGMQPENPWYYVGLGLARGGQERWIEAAGMLALAAHTDSSVVSSAFITAITGFYERAGRGSNQLDWYKVATARFPDEPLWWLKLAQGLREADDTTNGLAAARRYVAMRPTEPLGQATLATFLSDVGKGDSAVDIAGRLAAADTSYKGFAMGIFWSAGTRAFRSHDYARSSQILLQGMTYARPDMIPRFSYYAGHADLQRSVQLGTTSSETRDCAAAIASDSLAFQADTLLRRAMSVDSATVSQVVGTTIPQVHQQVARLKAAYCQQGQQNRRRP